MVRSFVCRFLSIFTLFTLLLAVVANKAQARSGLAAYNQHTGAFVTAARHEPRGSVLAVTNPHNGRTITVRVNDRGPFNGNRILDLSTGAFKALYGGLGRGVGPVRYRVVSRGSEGRAYSQRKTYYRKRYSKRSKYKHRKSRSYKHSSRRR